MQLTLRAASADVGHRKLHDRQRITQMEDLIVTQTMIYIPTTTLSCVELDVPRKVRES